MGSIDEAKANAKRLRKANTEVNNESTEGYIGRLDEILREARSHHYLEVTKKGVGECIMLRQVFTNLYCYSK